MYELVTQGVALG